MAESEASAHTRAGDVRRDVFTPRWRWLRAPRRLSPTRAGWTFFALTFGVGFAALNTGNNLLYLVLSLMLAFLVLSGVLSESALRGVALRRRLPREMIAERDAWVTVEIHNQQSRVAAYALAVEDRVRGARGERAVGRCFALRVEAGGCETRGYRLRPDSRGELEFAGFVVYTRFPFGLFSKSLNIEASERALVYPALDPVALPEDSPAHQHGESNAGPTGRGADVGGLREFARGDAPRRIDWRSSLRAGELWVREQEGERNAHLDLRLRTGGRTTDAAFERDVRHCASQVVAGLDEGLQVGLESDTARFPAGSGPPQRARLLAYLARVMPSPSASEAG